MAANHHHESGNHHKKYEVAVVMVPLPAQGHLNQLLHLSRRLVSSAACLPVHYVGGTTHVRQAKLRFFGPDLAAAAGINFHEFPNPSFRNPKPDPHARTKFPVQIIPAITASLSLRDPVFHFVNRILSEYKRVVVIYDSLMAYVVQDVDSIQNVESYCFWSISAFFLYFQKWHRAGRPEIPDSEIRLALEGYPSPDESFTPEFNEFRAMQLASRKTFSGDIFNSSRVIEGWHLGYLADRVEKQWALGPFNPIEINNPGKNDQSKIKHECLDWLDKQDSPGSVLFVSFGTTTSIPDEQIKELAIGLEKSEQKFIWVLRDADKGDIFTGEVRKPILADGFEERVKGRGLVVREWAPQLEILGHSATGGFLSHCGWNSCMESMSMGVPIATWPMHSDQPANAILVTKVLKIGVEVKGWVGEEEIVPSGVIESAVRKLMVSKEGDEMRRRAQELGIALRKSVKESGSSDQEMDSFISHITR